MAWFGERKQLERERDELLHDKQASLDEQLRLHVARLDRLREPKRAPERVPPTSTALELDEELELARATYEFEATPAQLETLDLMFSLIASAGQWGATIYFDVMVDGDGAARISVQRDGQEIGLTDEEARAWFLGDEQPEHSRVLDVSRRDGVICIELV